MIKIMRSIKLKLIWTKYLDNKSIFFVRNQWNYINKYETNFIKIKLTKIIKMNQNYQNYQNDQNYHN